MEEKISGKQYNFSIKLESRGAESIFQILSVHKATMAKSVVTNVNFIISEIILPGLDIDECPTQMGTTLFLNNRNGKRLFKETLSTFNNIKWIESLEISLDEDRQIGGWNSNFSI